MRTSSDWIFEIATFLQLESRLGMFFIDLYLHHRRMHRSLYTVAGALTQQLWLWMPCPYLGRMITHKIIVIQPWENDHAYMLQPFTLITHCLEKFRLKQASAVLVALVWHSQLWYPSLLRALADYHGG